MPGKLINFMLRGMLRDLSVSKFNPQYAYENMNLRFTIDKDNTLLSIVNEKGPRELQLFDSGGLPVVVMGSFLGHNVLNNIVTIFTKSFTDRIYRLVYDYERDLFVATLLFEGNLKFDAEYPIETIGIYENEDIQKIYWLDGINQPRVINVAESNNHTRYNENSFDFALELSLNETITVTKNNSTVGVFAPGVIQYAFSYFNRYGQESSIFYTTPLNYISHSDRGGSPEENVSNSFTIDLHDLDKNFEYVRVYSILRSSLNATPICKRVVDLALQRSENIEETYLRASISYAAGTGDINKLYLFRNGIRTPIFNLSSTLSSDSTTGDMLRTWTINNELGTDRVIVEDLNGTFSLEARPIGPIRVVRRTTNSGSSSIIVYGPDGGVLNIYECIISYTDVGSVSYTDNGVSEEDIDPTELLFKGSEEITAGTFTHKDNTMFIGDIKILRLKIPASVKSGLRGASPVFNNEEFARDLPIPEPSGLYPYQNLLFNNSSLIKAFKYLDWYRFGVLFQHKTGKWSEPIFIRDLRNEFPVNVSTDLKSASISSCVLLDLDYSLIKQLVDIGYVRVRGMIVYPDFVDREVLALGVLMPTVYNVKDRATNSPFSMSSWFARPNIPFDYARSINDTRALDPDSSYSRADFLERNSKNSSKDEYTSAIIEHRHNFPLPGNVGRNGEIQCLHLAPTPYVAPTALADLGKNDFIDLWGEAFYIDQSILTLHSPDIEFDDYIKTINSDNLKLRIVGLTPITGNMSDIDITTSTATLRPEAIGFYNRAISFNNLSRAGARSFCSSINWFDWVWGGSGVGAFLVYPWHRSGSLTNQGTPTGDETRFSVLDRKKLSNLRFSFNSLYYGALSLWRANISGVGVFNSNEQTLLKLPALRNSGLEEITYYGNIDKVVNITRLGDDRRNGYDIVVRTTNADENGPHKSYGGITTQIKNLANPGSVHTGVDPVHIKYKSTPHAVVALDYIQENRLVILPTIYDEFLAVNRIDDSTNPPFWAREDLGPLYISLDILDTPSTGGNVDNIGYGFFWLAELYNDQVVNRFGGDDENAIENNLWYPASTPIRIVNPDGSVPDNMTIVWTEGDTFYLRYDCLKTYPYTQEDKNSVIDITSFMCETRINLDGRYDRNRGQRNNLAMSPTNFNLFNPVYNQLNNYFNYRAINSEKLQPDNFKNIITWSLAKTLGETVDTWTNITLASTLDMDGDKGPIRALRRFNNEIYSFQDKGIARVLFNSRVLLNPSDGVPIEIGNSYKVDGKVYLGLNIGCMNKWSIVSTLNGIYFIDNLGKSIYLFNGGSFLSLSDAKGFRSFISELNSLVTWNNELFENFITHYDSANKDVYFINKDFALVYSETLGEFTSFYSYEHTPLMFNAGYKNFMFRNNRVWEQWGGDYNNFFGQVKPFYTTLIVNPEQDKDKIFNNIEFRADTYNGYLILHDKTFDTLEIWNEYLNGFLDLKQVFGKPSSLKKKFRIWRTNIPRDNSNGRDRIRNTWAYLKLSMNNPEATRTEIHDINVGYFV